VIFRNIVHSPEKFSRAERAAELARAELTGARLLIEQDKAQLHKLRRMQVGRPSEALDAQIQQLELRLEDLEEGEAARQAAAKSAARISPSWARMSPRCWRQSPRG
jgi:transposase